MFDRTIESCSKVKGTYKPTRNYLYFPAIPRVTGFITTRQYMDTENDSVLTVTKPVNCN